MKLKSISKILATIILCNSLFINTSASTLSEDTRYETFNDNHVTIDNILEDSANNLKISGKTLVNNCLDSTKDGVLIENIVRFNSSIIKPNSEYTLIFEVTENNLTENDVFIIELPSWRESARAHVYPGQTGLFIKKVTTSDTVNLISWIGGDGIGNVTLKNLIVLEGDYTNKSIPYFEGIQSSFEDQLVTQDMVDSGEEDAKNLGKYKVEYNVTGKNKFNSDLERGYGYPHMGLTTSGYQEYLRGTILIPVKENTQYSISFEDPEGYVLGNQYGFLCFNADKKLFTNCGYSSKLPVGTKYVLPSFKTNQNPAPLDAITNIQIEEGSAATEYEPYKEQINTFYLNSPLLQGDTIEIIDGQPTHVKRYGQEILNGDEEWYRGNPSNGWNQDGDNIAFHSYNALSNKKASGYSITNTFNTYNNKSIVSDSSFEGFSLALTGGRLYSTLRINKSKLPSEDVDGLKTWLSQNPVTVVYELAEPIYEPIDVNLSIDLNLGTTHITNNSTIPANMEITVDRVANRAQEAIELAKNTPTVENLSQARYWTNLLKESTLKDEFQSEINNKSDVIDMYIERKTASVNSDVYIKMKNTLSLSLNTNSIIFDDVDVTEDTELKNVVNLTISSSLPYKVNAYLEDEIYNAEKTAIIDKSALNIKVSSDNAYKAFINTTDPIILLDNQTEGSNISHKLDFMLSGGTTHKADVYKSTIKLEVEQK